MPMGGGFCKPSSIHMTHSYTALTQHCDGHVAQPHRDGVVPSAWCLRRLQAAQAALDARNARFRLLSASAPRPNQDNGAGAEQEEDASERVKEGLERAERAVEKVRGEAPEGPCSRGWRRSVPSTIRAHARTTVSVS